MTQAVRSRSYIAALAATCAVLGFAGSAAAVELSTTLTGAAERPGPGDADGAGTATVKLDIAKGEVCYELKVSNIATANMAHIHKGAADAAGGVVVPLTAPAEGSSSGCVTPADPAVVKAIAEHPGDYYVNVHNAEFKPGAIRGQLK